jgi:hypothetical protein
MGGIGKAAPWGYYVSDSGSGDRRLFVGLLSVLGLLHGPSSLLD